MCVDDGDVDGGGGGGGDPLDPGLLLSAPECCMGTETAASHPF